MKVVDVPVGKLKRYSNNPRKNSEAVQAIRRSLDEFGWKQPIVVDKHYVIIVGDTRFQAALSRGDTHVPVHVATDLTEAKIKAYRIADNKLNEISEWDDSRLLEEITDLIHVDYSLEGLGFTADELDALMGKPTEPVELQDFDVSPTGRNQWVVIHASEADCSKVLERVKLLKLKSIKMEYSGDAYPDGLRRPNRQGKHPAKKAAGHG